MPAGIQPVSLPWCVRINTPPRIATFLPSALRHALCPSPSPGLLLAIFCCGLWGPHEPCSREAQRLCLLLATLTSPLLRIYFCGCKTVLIMSDLLEL